MAIRELINLFIFNNCAEKIVFLGDEKPNSAKPMISKNNRGLSRRKFVKLSAAAAQGIAIIPSIAFGSDNSMPSELPSQNTAELMKRRFGKTNFYVTTLGLGGQAAIQWTPQGVIPANIITKAIDLGINYFDTSNAYGKSQLHFNTAFIQRNLIPGISGYNASLRESIFLTSKTGIRWAKGGYPTLPNVNNNTGGTHGEGAVGDLKRSLSQIFGDNQGNYPQGAYLNLFLIHNLVNFEEVDVLYKGFETPLNLNENFGALIALRDYRDGTNFTGLNPNNEKLIKHIGFSGHRSAPVMMDMIRRDKWSLLDTMLIAINVNDRRYLNMQYNAIEVAEAKDMGVVGMKVFADGAMYTKVAVWGNKPEELVFTVGSEAIPSKSLIEYSLTTPGVDTLILGIGHINQDPLKCQLIQNLEAAQIAPDALSEQERRELENLGLKAKDGKTNYFQLTGTSLTPPSNIKLTPSENKVIISWNTAIAGSEPISHYEVLRDGIKIQEINHFPQTSSIPFSCIDDTPGREYAVATVDLTNRKALSNTLQYSPTGIINTEIQKVTIYAYRKEIFIQGILQDGMVVSIYSLNGKLMKSFRLRNDTSKLYSFSADDLKSGVYIVRIQGNGEIETGRIYLE